tara:strand:+ start:973 stop:1674 length:702 start_codon:yes stop_codon:yes gene_type:complete
MHDDDLHRVWQACKAKATCDFLQTIPGMADSHATCVVAPTVQEANGIARVLDAKDITVCTYMEDALGWSMEAHSPTPVPTYHRLVLAWPPLAVITPDQIRMLCERVAACACAGAWVYVLALYQVPWVGNDTVGDEGWMRYADALTSCGLEQVVCAKQRYALEMPSGVRQPMLIEALQATWGAPLAACLTKGWVGSMGSETQFTAHVVCAMARVPTVRHQGVYATVPVDSIARR